MCQKRRICAITPAVSAFMHWLVFMLCFSYMLLQSIPASVFLYRSPEASASEVSAAEVSAAETSAPEISAPEASASEAYAPEVPDVSGMNVVLVLDESGSMKHTDPDRLSCEAALLFLDMMEEKGCNAAILSFSDEVKVLRPMQELNMQQEREEIRSLLLSGERRGDTDLGAAARKALDMAQEQTAVIFLTDGMVDLPDEEEKQRSLKEVQKAAAEAGEKGIPFYCVGLDDTSNTSDYHLDRRLLETVADETGGSFQSVEEAQELPDLFHRIFSDFIQTRSLRIGELHSSAGEEASLSFTVPDSSVLEANVILLPVTEEHPSESLSPVTGGHTLSAPVFTLKDPSGDAVSFDSEYARISVSSSYTLIKLLAPEQGEWSVCVSSDEDYTVHVNLLFHYEAELSCSVKEDSSGDALVCAFLTADDVPLDDPLLCSHLMCRAKVTREGSPAAWAYGLKDTYSLDLDEKECCWTGHIEVYPGSTITLEIFVSGEALSRQSSVLRFTSERSDAIIVDRLPDEILLEGMFAGNTQLPVSVSALFHSWDGTKLKISPEAEDDSVLHISSLTEEGENDFLLQGNRSGQTSLKITAEDIYGNRVTKHIPVRIRIFWEMLRWLLIIPVSAIIAVPAIVMCRRCAAGKTSGTLFLTDRPFSGEEGAAFPLDSFDGPANLGTIISCILSADGELYKEEKLAGKELFRRFPEPQLPEILSALKEISVNRCRKNRRGFMIRLKNKGSRALLCDCYGNVSDRIYLQDADVFEIRLSGEITFFGSYYRGPDGQTSQE